MFTKVKHGVMEAANVLSFKCFKCCYQGIGKISWRFTGLGIQYFTKELSSISSLLQWWRNGIRTPTRSEHRHRPAAVLQLCGEQRLFFRTAVIAVNPNSLFSCSREALSGANAKKLFLRDTSMYQLSNIVNFKQFHFLSECHINRTHYVY